MDVTELKRMYDILRKGGAISGLADCHIPGIYSIVLQKRSSESDGMLRIFYRSPAAELGIMQRSFWTSDATGDYTVMPHNHRQDISLYKIFGRSVNCLFDIKPLHRQKTDRPVYEHAFTSALLSGSFDLRLRRAVKGGMEADFIPFHGVNMKWNQVHTIASNEESAWLVKERDLAPDGSVSLCYSLYPNKKLESKGLYRPMGRDDLMEVSDHILAMYEREIG